MKPEVPEVVFIRSNVGDLATHRAPPISLTIVTTGLTYIFFAHVQCIYTIECVLTDAKS